MEKSAFHMLLKFSVRMDGMKGNERGFGRGGAKWTITCWPFELFDDKSYFCPVPWLNLISTWMQTDSYLLLVAEGNIEVSEGLYGIYKEAWGEMDDESAKAGWWKKGGNIILCRTTSLVLHDIDFSYNGKLSGPIVCLLLHSLYYYFL